MNQFDKACLNCALLFCDEKSLRCARRREVSAYKASWRARQRARKADLKKYRAERGAGAQQTADQAMTIYQEAITIQRAQRGAK